MIHPNNTFVYLVQCYSPIDCLHQTRPDHKSFTYKCQYKVQSHLLNVFFFFLKYTKILIYFFSSPGPKVHVNYCHHLASIVCRLSSVVCKLFTFQASSPKPLGRLETNLAGMFLGWSSTKLLFFVPVGYSIWLPGPIICSDWLKFQSSSSPKLMN